MARKNKIAVVLIAALVVISAVLFYTDRSRQLQAATDVEISAKLDEVLRGIKAIQDDLQVIKVRITQW